MTEDWVDLCDEEGNHGRFYQISSLGRLRSLDRPVKTKDGVIGNRKAKLKTLSVGRSGYLVVGYIVEGRLKQRPVNRLVAFSFYGSPPSPTHQAAHGDGDRKNNVRENIRWATPLENAADKKLHGTDNRGSANPRAILTEDDVDRVVILAAEGHDQLQIASEVGSNSVTVNHILTGRSWSHRTGIIHKRKYASITREMIEGMRKSKREGMRLQDIADRFGVSKAATFRYTAPAVMAAENG